MIQHIMITNLGNQLGVNFFPRPWLFDDVYDDCHNLGSERRGLNFLELMEQDWDRHLYWITLSIFN